MKYNPKGHENRPDQSILQEAQDIQNDLEKTVSAISLLDAKTR